MRRCVVLGISLVLFASTASADVAPNPVPRYGESIAAKNPTKVTLRDETVTITLGPDEASVRASFTLVNATSSEERLVVGFPTAAQVLAGSEDKDGVHVTKWGPTTIHDLRVKVDGAIVATESRDGSLGPRGFVGWEVWNMSFAPGATRTVIVTYDVPTVDRNLDAQSFLRNREVAYILTTGSGWAGPISRATIIVQGGPGISIENIVSAVPEPTTKEELRWTWVMENFKPTADVLVKYRVFRDARHAADKLWRTVKEFQAGVDDVVTYAQATEALGNDREAAELWAQVSRFFERPYLTRKEGGEVRVISYGNFYGPKPYVPPALRAARLFDKVGDVRARAYSCREALDRIKNLESISAQDRWYIQKALRIDGETLKAYRAECIRWIGKQ